MLDSDNRSSASSLARAFATTAPWSNEAGAGEPPTRSTYLFGNLVGASDAMRDVFRVLSECAKTDLSILLTGETGTGKELTARAIHESSARAKGPFVELDCSTIPPSLAESCLFGHERGAFTGATGRVDGAFQEAEGGTLFLDEIGELPMELQPKLLRALAEKKVKRVGATRYETANVRIVAATLRQLDKHIAAAQFRSDLFYRLVQVEVELPPLRERREDIGAIAEAVCVRLGKSERLGDVQRALLQYRHYGWPGNVRELVNVVTALATLPPDAITLKRVLPRTPVSKGQESVAPFTAAKHQMIAEFEARYFSHLIQQTQGNVTEMARRSGLFRHHVRGFLKKYNLATPGGVSK